MFAHSKSSMFPHYNLLGYPKQTKKHSKMSAHSKSSMFQHYTHSKFRKNYKFHYPNQSSPKIDTIKFIIPEISYNITSVFLENIKKLFSQDTIYLTTMLPKEIAIVGVRNNVLNKLINLVAFTRIPSVTARC